MAVDFKWLKWSGLIGLLLGCAHSEQGALPVATSHWQFCALESTELGYYGRQVDFRSDGEMILTSGYYQDPHCAQPGPYMVESRYQYQQGPEDEEGFIPLEIQTTSGLMRTRMHRVNGYLYLPENILLSEDNPIDHDTPFVQFTMPAH